MAIVQKSDGSLWEYRMGMERPRQLSEAEAFAVKQNPLAAGLYAGVHHARGTLGMLPGVGGLIAPDAEDRLRYEALQERFPVSTFLGGAAPYAIGPGGFSGGMAQALAKRLGYDAGLGIADVESGGEWWERAGWSALGSGVMDMASRVAGRVANVFTDFRTSQIPTDEVAQRALDEGFELTPGMRTANRAIQDYEHSVSQEGIGARIKQRALQGNQERLNRQAADAIGVQTSPDGKILDDQIDQFNMYMDDVYGRVFGELADKGGMRASPATVATAMKHIEDIDLRDRILNKTTLSRAPDGTVRYQLKQGARFTSDEVLGMRQAVSPMVADKNANVQAAALKAMTDIDDRLGQKIGGPLKNEFDVARARYRTFIAVESSVNDLGDVTPGRLSQRMKSVWGKGNVPSTWGRTQGAGANPAAEAAQNLRRSAGALNAVMPRSGSMTPQGMADLQSSLMKSATQGIPYYKMGIAPKYEGLLEPARQEYVTAGQHIGRGLLAPAARSGLDTETYQE